MEEEVLREGTQCLLKSLDRDQEFSIYRLSRSGNNRAFVVEVDKTRFFLKDYFKHEHDKRDRLSAEVLLCRFAEEAEIRNVPRVFAYDRELNLALYEFIEGVQLGAGDISELRLTQLADFFQALNKDREIATRLKLPIASEAFFSIEGHLNCLRNRIERLANINGTTAVDRDALLFINTQLLPASERVFAWAHREASLRNLSCNEELESNHRVISPSDFGFHNTILVGSELYFVDFEYSGWDEVAKMVCDLFCQVAIPVPVKYIAAFTERVVKTVPNPEMHLARTAVLLPVYQLKWCCIVLNEFLKVGLNRRQFAEGNFESIETRKVEQLEKAIKLLFNLEEKERVAHGLC